MSKILSGMVGAWLVNNYSLYDIAFYCTVLSSASGFIQGVGKGLCDCTGEMNMVVFSLKLCGYGLFGMVSNPILHVYDETSEMLKDLFRTTI